MTAIAPEAAILRTTPASAQRTWRVVRLALVNKWSTVWTPIMVMAFIWLVNYVIWWIIYVATPESGRAKAMEGTEWAGGGFYIFVYMLIVGITVVSATFPFALGYSVTRRDFWFGASLTFLLLSVGYAIGFSVLSFIEEWTNGWGLGGHLFTSVYFSTGGFFTRFFVVFVMLLFVFFLGAASATLFMRWRMAGLLVAGAVLAIVIVGLVALVTFTQSWPAVGTWFADMGPVGVVAWLLVPTVISALAGFFVLRRATPKS
ncbi:hypothetical protein [Leifsonia poae]|uniref:hypothetical protein n=1 Tax=Leifsonia poae TaxID=110933 RepID=UPI003D6721BD